MCGSVCTRECCNTNYLVWCNVYNWWSYDNVEALCFGQLGTCFHKLLIITRHRCKCPSNTSIFTLLRVKLHVCFVYRAPVARMNTYIVWQNKMLGFMSLFLLALPYKIRCLTETNMMVPIGPRAMKPIMFIRNARQCENLVNKLQITGESYSDLPLPVHTFGKRRNKHNSKRRKSKI